MTAAPDVVADEVDTYERCMAGIRARAAGEAEGLFGPGSGMWRAVRSVAVPLGGMRAVMLQIAHPAVAAAGAQNSSFKEEFLPRARRTFATIYRMQFGGLDEALDAGRRVHAMHRRIRGTIPTEASVAQAGQGYRANDPALLAWVLATMIDGAIVAHELLLEPLDVATCEAFYQDMRVLALAMGMPLDALPEDHDGFRAYFGGMLESDVLEVGRVGRELSDFLFTEGWNAWQLDQVWVGGLLPPRFRRAYGLPWNLWREAAHHGMRRTLRRTLRSLPAPLCDVPPYHRAMRRLALARAASVPFAARAVHAFDRIEHHRATRS